MLIIYSFFNLRLRKGLTVDFLLAPLLTTISHLMGHSKLRTFEESYDSLSTYTATVAQPSTGKSKAMEMIKLIYAQIENYFQVPANQSQMSNTPTVEALYDLLSKNNCIICNFLMNKIHSHLNFY